MTLTLKPLAEQVVVVTGASSGIGLATALAAADQGARLVLAARSTSTLSAVAGRIVDAGGHAIAVTADVGRRADVEGISDAALARFGRIDTWVNNAGVGLFGRLDEVGDEDSLHLFQTNFWGVVYGSLVAVPMLRKGGGALINLGSEESDAWSPLQGMYSASKHAVKGFTDALRAELDADGAPVSVTLVEPTAVDTPFPDHAGNWLAQPPTLPAPKIEVEQVASAILKAATEPTREVKVGARAAAEVPVAAPAPALVDKVSRRQFGRLQRNATPRSREGTLYRPGESGRVRGRDDAGAADTADAPLSNARPT